MTTATLETSTTKCQESTQYPGDILQYKTANKPQQLTLHDLPRHQSDHTITLANITKFINCVTF